MDNKHLSNLKFQPEKYETFCCSRVFLIPNALPATVLQLSYFPSASHILFGKWIKCTSNSSLLVTNNSQYALQIFALWFSSIRQYSCSCANLKIEIRHRRKSTKHIQFECAIIYTFSQKICINDIIVQPFSYGQI